jgi:hypothetical protein
LTRWRHNPVRPEVSKDRAELVEAWVDSSSAPFGEVRCRSVAAAGDLPFFVSPKKPKAKKGEPGVCLPQGFCGRGSDADSGSGSRRAVAIVFIAAHARSNWSRGQKHLRNRPAAWFLGSDHNFAAKHPQGKPKARRIWALTPKNPESAPAPEVSPPTPCGRAERRRLGRIKILDARRLRSRLVSKISGLVEQRKEPRSGPDFGSPFFGSPYFGEARKGKSPAAATARHRTHQRTQRATQTRASTGSAGTASGMQGFYRLSPNGTRRWRQEVHP